MNSDRDRRCVEDILELCARAARLVSRGQEAFESDEMLQLAGEALVSRIGEAASRLSPEFRDRRPHVAWRSIRGMRNLVTHEYGRIDTRQLWNTLYLDFPALAGQSSEDSDPSPSAGEE